MWYKIDKSHLIFPTVSKSNRFRNTIDVKTMRNFDQVWLFVDDFQ